MFSGEEFRRLPMESDSVALEPVSSTQLKLALSAISCNLVQIPVVKKLLLDTVAGFVSITVGPIFLIYFLLLQRKNKMDKHCPFFAKKGEFLLVSCGGLSFITMSLNRVSVK
jgi:hypothetical protein